MRASISERFSVGNRPATVVLPFSSAIPGYLRGIPVMGRADYVAYQGVILDSRSRILWRGRQIRVCSSVGTVTIRGKTYTGRAVSALSEAEAKVIAMGDAMRQLTTYTPTV